MSANSPSGRRQPGLLARSRLLLLLAAGVLAVYMITYNGTITSADEMSLLAETESLVKRGNLRTDQLIWAVWAHGWQAQGTLGPDGHVYSKKGFGLPLLLAPGFALALAVPAISKVHTAFLVPILSSVGVVLVMFGLARRWRATQRAALALALITALATPLWPYSRTLFQETPSALALLLAVYAITGKPRLRDWLLTGVALAAGIAIRSTNALAVAPVLLYGLYRARTLPRRQSAALLAALLGPAVLAVLSTGWLNWQHFGSPFDTGYSPTEAFTTPLWHGLYGMILSPAKGLLFFAPVLLIALIGAPASWRRRPAETALLLALAGSFLVLFSLWYDWGGGLAWGPRFALPVVPLLMPLLLPLLEGEGRPATRVAAALLVALSVLIQVAASTTPYRDTAGPFPVLAAFRHLGGLGWRGLDTAWLAARPDVQWLLLAWFAGVAVCALAGLIVFSRSDSAARFDGLLSLPARYMPLLLLALALVGCVAGLLRIHADTRLPGGDDYRSLAALLAQATRSSDTVLLDNHTRTEFFLSEDRSRAPRYDLLRGDALSAPAAELLGRLVRHPGVLWLISDRPASADVPRPEESWLDRQAFRWRELSFSPHARLIGYRVPAAPDMQPGAATLRFENGWEVTRWSVERGQGQDREGAGPAFHVTLEPGATAAAGLSASLQLIAADGSLAWQSDRALDPSAGPVELRGAVDLPAGAAGAHRLLLVLYDAQTGQRAGVIEPATTAGRDAAELAQIVLGG